MAKHIVQFVGAEKANGPYAINGYYPLYPTEADSNQASGGNGTSHVHTFFGQTFYMPNGLTMGVTQFHGDYDGSLTAEYNAGTATNSATPIKGYNYYKLNGTNTEYHTAWKMVPDKDQQRIITSYNINQIDIDRETDTFYIGCVPNVESTESSGYDFYAWLNAKRVTDVSYVADENNPGYIKLGSSVTLNAGDFLEISAKSDSGLLSETGVSKYELPLSWGHNSLNSDISTTSVPEYLEHFKTHIEKQKSFSGEVLGSNNYNSTKKVAGVEKEIVQTNQDIILGAYLTDDHPGNLIDALRFNANEYEKYKNRLVHEIENYYDNQDTTGLTNEQVLDQILRNVTSFKIGKDVFNKSYILPYGDNYTQEDFTIALGQTEITLSNYVDLDLIENSLLLYKDNVLLTVDEDYEFSTYNPIKIKILTSTLPGDVIVTKLYNSERDSAQCPPTPSTMGIYPLYKPCIFEDKTFKTPINVLMGHDGSKRKVTDDFRDDILLEYEKRIYNSAKAEFRSSNSLPEYNVFSIRDGAFRNSGYQYNDFYDLMRHYYSSWVNKNGLDPVVNEFYDIDDKWSWNYSAGVEQPGHWRGWFEYYYDTPRPHTHPWEMLAFTDKPTWWDSEYYVYADSDTSKINPIVDYGSGNTKMWQDLENGIVRQGAQENLTNDRWKTNNPCQRIGLSEVLPVDANGELKAPADIKSTNTTTITTTWNNSNTTPSSYNVSSFRLIDGLNVSTDTNNVYVVSNNLSSNTQIKEQEITFNFPKINLASQTETPSAMSTNTIAVLVNGAPLVNIKSDKSFEDQSEWHYNKVETTTDSWVINSKGVKEYYTITPDVVGLTEWSTTEHSPIVGWAFDGLPIYGPYGYSDPNDNTSAITRIESRWVVDSRARGTVNNESAGPGGKPTGQFVEDFKNDTTRSGNGYADQYNVYYSVTPDSPNTKIRHYVATIDSNSNPVFPYHVGGGSNNQDQRWQNKYFAVSNDLGRITSITIDDAGGLYTSAPTITITGDGTSATATATVTDGKLTAITVTNGGTGYTYATATVTGGGGVRGKVSPNINEFDNGTNKGYVDSTATAEITSTKNVSKQKDINQINSSWKFGDGSPVENTWKYTSIYPFAITEALLLARPGRFATIFSDPTKLVRPKAQPLQLLSKNTLKRWKFLNQNDFAIHGDINSTTGNMITNIGYTQFIYSWLKFQGLDVVTDFVNPLRTLNTKLAHRMSGFIDKDTLTARTDQYSNDGKASSLIIPKDNIHISLHSSNYKTRSFYSGVIIEQASSGYVVRGFDKNRGYFEVLELNKSGHRSEVTVGGDPVPHTNWEPNKTYIKDSIIEHLGGYYIAPLKISSGPTFDKSLWTRLPALPQENAVTGVYYHENTGVIKRVPYETVYNTVQDVFEFITSLGQYHESIGYNFGEYDSAIGDVRNWDYSAKQFLFWTSGTWSIGNTLELSPLANKVTFIAPRGFIAKINRTDREQFNILDQEGTVIDPTECKILREESRIEISPPSGKQIYSILLFTKEVEHAMVFDNKTQFNDVIFDDVLNQRHRRIKLKGNRTSGWTGRFSSEGFIIDGDELKPNLDNLAESLGRYHEFGFIPVEKQLYEASRALFGYDERQYLSELDINDDEQFDFYRGLLQNKGTKTSLSRIARSSAVVQGNVSVFDEWALKVGEFGDVDKKQSVELKLVKDDIVQDPQLIRLAFPEDTTNIIERIDVINPKYSYYKAPTIEITEPQLGGVQATATATINSDNKLDKITVTNPGSNYSNGASAKVIASNVVISSNELSFNNVIATQSGFIDFANVSAITITDNQSSNSASTISIANNGSANATVAANIATSINTNVSTNANISAKVVASHTSTGVYYSTVISGADFTVSGGTALGITDGTYQPVQRYAIENTMSGTTQTVDTDIIVKVDSTTVLSDSGNNWVYHAGSRNSITTTQQYPIVDTTASRASGNIEYPLSNTSATFVLSTPVQTANLEKNSKGQYKFIELFIGNVQIRNATDSTSFGDHDNNANTAAQSYVTSDNTLFELSANGAQITFPDISLLPSSVKTTVLNPPNANDANGEQQKIVEVLPVGSNISIAESPTVTFDNSFKLDKPGSTLNIKVVANDGIATRIGTRRNYLITEDAKDDDIILIDIDDADRFIKKPSGERNTKLWNTTSLVNSTGVTDQAYPTILNSGYVNNANVNFQAFDVGSIASLHDDDIIIKPNQGDLIHVAKSEANEWNVYKLLPVGNGDSNYTAFLEIDNNKPYLYTNYSLFNYIDSNEIGAENTGKYLDYYLTLKNKNLSDNVVVWTNEDIIGQNSSKITDFEAPRMIEARIESIGPKQIKPVFKTEPFFGKIISGLTLTPQGNTSIVTVTGNTTGLADGDAVQLYDNVGEQYNFTASISAVSGNEVKIDPVGVYEVANISGGSGYQAPPTVTFNASPSGDTAKGLATITGGVSSITITDGGSGYTTSTTVNISGPDLPGGTPASVTGVTIDSNGAITGFTGLVAGTGYSRPPTVSLNGAFSQPANLTAVINGAVDKVYIVRPGSGYSATGVTVTMSAPPSGSTATATVYRNNNAELSTLGKTADEIKEILPTRNRYAEVSNDASKVKISLLGNITDDIAYKIDPPRTDAEQEQYDALRSVINGDFALSSYDNATDTFNISHPSFGVSNVLTKLENTGYNITTFNSYTPGVGTFYTITDVNARSFKINAAGTSIQYSTNVSAYHLNKTKVTVPYHGKQVGDVIRLDCNNFSGQYEVKKVLSDQEFVVDAPFVRDFQHGDMYGQGVTIKTIVPHEISPEYVNKGRRVAVSYADPKSFNKLYLIDEITPSELIVKSGWAPQQTTVKFYERKVGTLTGAVPYDGTNRSTATNIITVTDDPRLRERVVQYTGNSDSVANNYSSIEADLLIVDPNALPAQLSDNTWPPVGISVQRQRRRIGEKYPVVATVDYNHMTVNGSTFRVDAYNNPKGLEHSINKATAFRRAVTDRSKSPRDGYKATFTMLNDISQPLIDGKPAYNLSNYGPYISEEETIIELGQGQIDVVDEFKVKARGEDVIDEKFNKGSRKKGPVKGLHYSDPLTGIEYTWNPFNGSYTPKAPGGATNVKPSLYLPDLPIIPECHVGMKTDAEMFAEWQPYDTAGLNSTELADTVYDKGSVYIYDGVTYIAERDINASDSETFSTTASNSSVLWSVATNNSSATNVGDAFISAEVQENEQLIAKILNGSGTDDNNTPGVKQRYYNMLSTKQFTTTASATITIPKYRIVMSSEGCYTFDVFQAVQNDLGTSSNGHIYYIKVDQLLPGTAVPHQYDIFATVSAYNNFTHEEGGVTYNFKKTAYYYINGIIPTVDGSNRITNANDPVLLENTVSVVELEDVEPGAYIGNSTVPEPFAMQGGNGTSAEANYNLIGRLCIDERDIQVEQAGNNKYFIWTPGLTANEWEPTEEGPGNLQGVNGGSAVFGYGRGYYTLNDTHLPDDYPNIREYLQEGQTPYNTPMPRFMYSKKFDVFPKACNYTTFQYLDATGAVVTEDDDYVEVKDIEPIICDFSNESTDTRLPRPEEIFVACFWTEPHVYRQQLTGIDYNTLDALGNPTPVYTDYNGTVVRVKYIRLTELPPSAVTRRLIPDTGWAGREWLNKTVDNYDPETDGTILDYYQYQPSTSGGSTGDEDEEINVILTIGDPTNEPGGAGYGTDYQGSVNLDEGGQLQTNLSNPDIFVPSTPQGPVLNGEVLKGMPGPCETVPLERPPETDSGIVACTDTSRDDQMLLSTNLSAQRRGVDTGDNKSFTAHRLNTNQDNQSYPYRYDNSNWHFETVKIAGKEDFTAFFNFPNNIYGSIAIVQSDTPYFNKVALDIDAGNQNLADNIVLETLNLYADDQTDIGLVIPRGQLRAFRVVTNNQTTAQVGGSGIDITGSFTFGKGELANAPKIFVTDVLSTITGYDTIQGITNFTTIDPSLYTSTPVVKNWYQPTSGSGARFTPSSVFYLCFDNRGGSTQATVKVSRTINPDPNHIDPPTLVVNDEAFNDREWWKTARIIKSTDVSGLAIGTDGTQIGRYGFDNIGGSTTKRIQEVDDHILGNQFDPGSYAFDKSPNIRGNHYEVSATSASYGNVSFTKGSHRVLANHLQSLPVGEKDAGNLEAGAPVNLEKFYDYDIGVKGPGFIQTEVNCQRGEYITVFIRPDATVSRSDLESEIKWYVALKYVGQAVTDPEALLSEALPGEPIDPDCIVKGGASGWASGATYDLWAGGNSYGYFGSQNKHSEDERTGQVDNIFWPHNPYPQVDDRNFRRTNADSGTDNLGSGARGATTANMRWKHNLKRHWREDNLHKNRGAARKIQTTTIKTFAKPVDPNAGSGSGGTNRNWLRNYSCLEVKGYFKAPVTGVYEVMTSSDDGLWTWISSSYNRTSALTFKGKPLRIGVDDMVGRDADGELLPSGAEGHGEKEYFKEDGYRAQDKYNYSRYNSLTRVGWLTTDTNHTRLVLPNRYVFLEEGKYYFMRFITGNNKGPGYADVQYNVYAHVPNGVNLEETPQYTDGRQLLSGQFFEFSGRGCTEETPGSGSSGSGSTGGGSTGGGNTGGGNQRYQQQNSNVSDGQRDGYGAGDYTETSYNNYNDDQMKFYADIDYAPAEYITVDMLGTFPITIDTPYYQPGNGLVPGYYETLANGNKVLVPEQETNTPIGNASKPGQRELTGFNFLPSSMKNPLYIYDPNNYTFSENSLSDDNPITGNVQRVSGGKKIPMVRTLKSAVRGGVPLKSNEISDEPWGKNISDNTNLNKTTKKYIYNPKAISSTVNVNGKTIYNVANQNTGTPIDGDTTEYTGGAFGEQGVNSSTSNGGPGTGITSSGRPLQTLTNATEGRSEYSTVDGMTVFNTLPVIDIRPLELDNGGYYSPAGPKARFIPRRPTPETSFSGDDMVGVTEGSELIINGRRVVIRGNDVRDIKTQINCAEMGVNAIVNDSNEITLISCTGNPFTITNGCGGGFYKSVGDFHINRGFTQSKTTTQQYVAPLIGSDQPYGELANLDINVSANDPGTTTTATGGGGNLLGNSDGQVGLIQSDQVILDYIRKPDGSLEQHFFNTDNEEEVYNLPARIPIETSSATTAGSGYRVGDRLRLVGGTPVNDATGPIAEICINSAGAGYTNPANIRIIFNENGNAPGVGAAAAVTQLDENGGIAEILMLNNGAAYDVTNPPEITVQDLSPTPTVKVINAAWPDPMTVEPGQILKVNEVQQVQEGTGVTKVSIETINERFVRATANVVLGTELTANLRYNSSTGHDVTFQTTLAQPAVRFKNVFSGLQFEPEPETYVKVSYLPATSMNDYTANVVSVDNNSSNITLDSTANLSVGDILVKNDSGNLKMMARVTGVDTTSNVATVHASNVNMATFSLSNSEQIFWGKPQSQLFFIPKYESPVQPSVSDDHFIIQDRQFVSESIVLNMFGATQMDTSMDGFAVQFTIRAPWWQELKGTGGERPRFVDTIDPSGRKVKAQLTAEIGDVEGIPGEGDEATTYQKDTMHKNPGPLRVAKFIVTDIDELGAITGLRVIDRGLYKEFPSDLTYGIPLEYDYAPQGSYRLNANRFGNVFEGSELSDAEQAELREEIQNMFAHTLGVGDPSRPGVLYGANHPEYKKWPFESATAYLGQFIDTSGDDAASTIAQYEAIVDKVNSGTALTFDENQIYTDFLNALGTAIGFKTFGKHPDWTDMPEFVYTGANFVPYTGTPGGYDPEVWTAVDLRTVATEFRSYQTNPVAFAKRLFDLGLLKRKSNKIETNPLSNKFGQYIPNEVAGGTGARVFLTAQEIPSCTEKGFAKEQIGLPDVVQEVSAPKSLARQINDALRGAGYLDDEIKATYNPKGDLGQIEIDTTYPGVEFGEDNPGFLDSLGIPVGQYNTAMLCIEAEVENNNALTAEQKEIEKQRLIDELMEKEQFGLLDSEALSKLGGSEIPEDTYVLSLVCAEIIGNLPTIGTGIGQPEKASLQGKPPFWPLNDSNSIFGDGVQEQYSQLYKYDLVNVFGDEISLSGPTKQKTSALYFESKRFNDRNVIESPDEGVFSNQSITRPSDNQPALFSEANAWVDSYFNTSRKRTAASTDIAGDGSTNIVFDMPGFVEGGWVYFENGQPQRWQTQLVDLQYINNAIVYDPDTGNRITDLDVWDPFKGVLPGFIQNEIHYISEQDPASYNNARTVFGKQQVGKVWWDTSTTRYEWYEQGTNRERAKNWGKAFPGSQVTICEWVESKAIPANWTGNGVPRWTDRFVTERRLDPKTGEYLMYYYYWVMNRTVVDNRIKSKLNRKLDTRSIARYIANPRGYGLSMISYVSEDSFLLWNLSNIRQDETHLQINLSRNSNPEGISHSAWKLMREGDNNSDIPNEISDKLIDSLCGENAIAQPVPDPKLSDIEKYGIGYRPRQTMFRDVKNARRILVSKLNDILAGTRLNTTFAGWDISLPTARAYIETINWYEVEYTDPVTKKSIRYNDTIKPIFNVAGVAELYKLQNLADGSIIQVKSNQNDVTQLWKYKGSIDDFELIMEANDTIRIRDTLFTDDTNPTLSSELRLLLNTLKNNVFENTSTWNEIFFELLKYAYLEQKQLDWAFKTSYLYIEKEEDDLIEFNGFKPDNFQKVLDYMNEVKPYSSKIREYKDGKKTPVDLIGQNNISDYDKPPYVDFVSGNVRILDDNVTADRNIMANNKSYVDYWTATVDGLSTADPIRHSNTTIVFDRTNYRLTETNWDVANVDVNTSIGYNIANLTQLSNANISANASYRAADKIFKFDTQVQDLFKLEVNTYYNSQTAYRQANIVGNGTIMAGLVGSGQLKNTLALIKDKVGGNFRGDTLDGNEFSLIEENADYFSNVQTLFGFDTNVWDENTDNDTTVFTDERNPSNYGFVTTVGIGDAKWDNSKETVSYEGVFNQAVQGNVTLVKNDETYEGFDGVTFQRVLYGEERPEELAVIDPKETLIMTVTTSEFSRGDAGNVSIYDGDDLANATLFHQTMAVDNITILNPGIGYKSPTVVIAESESIHGNPSANASATVTTHANGAISGITVTAVGGGYKQPRITLSEVLTEALASNVDIGSDSFTLSSNANVLVGQNVSYSNAVLGSVKTISNNVITLDSTIDRYIASGQTINFSGQNFDATFDIEDESSPVANVFLNKAFVDLHPELTAFYGAGNIFAVDGNTSVVRFANVISFPNLVATSGANPDVSADFYAVDTTNGWDTGTSTGGVGSFDVALSEVQEQITTKVAPMSAEVKYRIHQNLFGGSDYLRISTPATTTLKANITVNSTSIELTDASFLPVPTSIVPGSIWVGDERINFGRRNGNTLSALTRGAYGTTPQNHTAGTSIFSAESNEHFNHLNPQSNIWLDQGTRYDSPADWDAAIDNTPLNTSDNDWTPTDAWDQIESANVTTSNVGVTVSNVTATTADLTLIGNANIAVGEGVKITSNANVSYHDVVQVTANVSGVLTITSSWAHGYTGNLDTANLFVDASNVTLTKFVYAGQESTDRWDSATISGETALSLADRANADFGNTNSIMRFLHRL